MKKNKLTTYLLTMVLIVTIGIFCGNKTADAKKFNKNTQVAIGNSKKLSVENKGNKIIWTVVSGKNNIKIVDKKSNHLIISGKKIGTTIIKSKISGDRTIYRYKLKVNKVINFFHYAYIFSKRS